jgi:branched-chain amino acid transport system ATP-binding protein
MTPTTQPGAPPPLLEIDRVSVRFGGVHALDAVNLTLAEGEICGLIGPNGAGKTTLFNGITRMYDTSGGSIRFAGHAIDRIHPREVVATGIARTFQNVGLYGGMTVLENVMLGAHHAAGQSMLGSLLRPTGARQAERELMTQCRSILHELDLDALRDEPAGAIPYPTQKRVEIARALASRPRLLLLDEPAGGLTHGEVAQFGELVRRIRDSYRLTVLLVEHHMGLVMGLCSRLVVMHLGRNLAQGTPAEVRANPEVVAAYLGRPSNTAGAQA